jgi:ABC-2 type transport system ATP-binding protein
MNAIEARGLVKQFDGFRAVDGVDLNVPEGSIYGILGPNGAGKTTMLRTLLGIIDPDEGTRTLLGSDRPITQSRFVGYLPEERGLYQSMRAVDTIAFMGAGLCSKKQGLVMPQTGKSVSYQKVWRKRCS